MARPFDPADNVAARIFDEFPEHVQEDEIFQRLFDHLFDSENNFDQMRQWEKQLDDYLDSEWDLDLDDYFDWDDWRESYDAHAS